MNQGAAHGSGLLERRDVLKTTGAGIVGAATVPGLASAQGQAPDDRGEGKGRPTKAILTLDPSYPVPARPEDVEATAGTSLDVGER